MPTIKIAYEVKFEKIPLKKTEYYIFLPNNFLVTHNQGSLIHLLISLTRIFHIMDSQDNSYNGVGTRSFNGAVHQNFVLSSFHSLSYNPHSPSSIPTHLYSLSSQQSSWDTTCTPRDLKDPFFKFSFEFKSCCSWNCCWFQVVLWLSGDEIYHYTRNGKRCLLLDGVKALVAHPSQSWWSFLNLDLQMMSKFWVI